VLLGRPIRDLEGQQRAAVELLALGPRAVVVKGGHSEGHLAIDVFFDGDRITELPARRVATPNTHGSGCTFSAAIAGELAKGASPLEAVVAAKAFITAAIEAALEVGRGHGPVNPLFRLTPVEGGSTGR
jgi:hydroxymethylpyrimidine/phosphomethylpyrimidine kinase